MLQQITFGLTRASSLLSASSLRRSSAASRAASSASRTARATPTAASTAGVPSRLLLTAGRARWRVDGRKLRSEGRAVCKARAHTYTLQYMHTTIRQMFATSETIIYHLMPSTHVSAHSRTCRAGPTAALPTPALCCCCCHRHRRHRRMLCCGQKQQARHRAKRLITRSLQTRKATRLPWRGRCRCCRRRGQRQQLQSQLSCVLPVLPAAAAAGRQRRGKTMM